MHGRSGQIRRAAFGNGNFGNDAAVNTVNESDRVILSVIYRFDLYVVNINAVVIFIAHIVFFHISSQQCNNLKRELRIVQSSKEFDPKQLFA